MALELLGYYSISPWFLWEHGFGGTVRSYACGVQSVKRVCGQVSVSSQTVRLWNRGEPPLERSDIIL
jgi:hypothetical protein